MRPALRLTVVVLGLVAALYGTASMTGGWLGTPPWSRTADGPRRVEWRDEHTGENMTMVHVFYDGDVTGVAAVVLGLALAGFGAWPRRRGELGNGSG